MLSAALYTGVAMFLASIPRRWGIASVSIAAFFIITAIVTVGLTESIEVSDWIALGSPDEVMGEAAERIMNDPAFTIPALDRLPGSALIATAAAYGVVALAATWWRYQRIRVER